MSDTITQTTYTAVIPAAGIGSRMQAEVPKQYLQLSGQTILEHTATRLLSHPQIEHVILALHPDDNIFDSLPLASHPNISTVVGGEERADSVLNGLQLVDSGEWVLVHDAARPCVRLSDITKLLALQELGHGGILAKRVVDTMKRSDGNLRVLNTEPRDNLWHALTPQFFPCGELKAALQECRNSKLNITDEASAMEHFQYPVGLVEGAPDNIKITVPEDLALANFYLTQQEQDKCA